MKLSKKLITLGLLAGTLGSLHASVPSFGEWGGYTRQSAKLLLNGVFYGIDARLLMLSNFFAKSYAPNQKIMFGDALPLIYLASMLESDEHLKTLLENQSTIVAVENPLGNTPMHYAAVNSEACLRALINDGRLDVNEHNKSGETPLFLALKHHPVASESITKDKMDGTIQALLDADKINLNSTDNWKRTMLHIAVKEGAPEALKIMLSTEFEAARYNDNLPPEEKSQCKIDFAAKDLWGNSALDYIFEVQDMATRGQIYDLLKEQEGMIFTITPTKVGNMKNAATDIETLANGIALAAADVATRKTAIITAADAIVTACDGDAEPTQNVVGDDAKTLLGAIIEQRSAIESAIAAIRELDDFKNAPMINLNGDDVKTAVALFKIENELKNL